MKKIYEKIVSCSAIFFGALILSFDTSAQTIIKGKVTDAESTLLPGVSVIPSKGAAAVTASDGAYSLNLPDGTYTLAFSMVGYKRIIKTVVLKGIPVVLDVQMEESGNQLNEVVVSQVAGPLNERSLTARCLLILSVLQTLKVQVSLPSTKPCNQKCLHLIR
ncbi:CarboxypepD_reg-like domain-containing protein [Pedobacter westerhofensis]|uniref:CarboxypepD_reg-like domain-containing protein n=1 Tax=Pedobacter westerhofensis TaxID=425512 RepID=A0A521FMV8_9SPHI|nr:carboxypeptidase-like regulatory domain-containing protein [Pedobacter westerhofensis]SMO97518.1 CarboxypepD_reg-like domain-containing protein [Pedobacter westerhofensis]